MTGCDAEEAFSCGLLHDIGKTVLFSRLEDYDLPAAAKIDLVKRFHAEAGALLAVKWNLPDQVVDVIEHHHDPLQATRSNTIVEVVYLANQLLHQRDDLDVFQQDCCHLNLEKIDFAQLQESVAQLTDR